MQAKDIPEQPILEYLARIASGEFFYRQDIGLGRQAYRSATWFAGFENSVQNAMPAGTPPKVALAKMRAMVRKKLVIGCACGCRGDFQLPDA